jgi:hypothetical protein
MRVQGSDPRKRIRVPDDPAQAELYVSRSDPPIGLPPAMFDPEWLGRVRLHQPMVLQGLELTVRAFEWQMVTKKDLYLGDLGAAEEDWADMEDEDEDI